MSDSSTHANLSKYGSVGDQALVANRDMYIDFYHIATGYCVKFKAFITSFLDQYDSKWSSQDVYGRMDPIMTFQGNTRYMTLSFDVPSVNIEEATRNLHAIEHLISQLYPTYEGDVLAGSPLMRVKFANLVKSATAGHASPDAKDGGLVGAFQGLSFAPDLGAGFFIPSAGVLIPKLFRVETNFTVLHDHPLGFKKGGKWRNNKYSFPYVTSPDGAFGSQSSCKKGTKIGVGEFNPSNSNVPEHVRRSKARGILD